MDGLVGPRRGPSGLEHASRPGPTRVFARGLGRALVGQLHRVAELRAVHDPGAQRRRRFGRAAQLAADVAIAVDVDPLADQRRAPAPATPLQVGGPLGYAAAQKGKLEIGRVIHHESHRHDLLRPTVLSFPLTSHKHTAGPDRLGFSVGVYQIFDCRDTMRLSGYPIRRTTARNKEMRP